MLTKKKRLQSKNGILQFQNGNGYVVVSSQDQDEELNHTVMHEAPNVTQVEEKPAVLLSTAQLILRRGLTTLAALLILAVGIAVHLIVPLPEVSNGAGANFTLDSNFTTATPSQWVSFETWTSDRFTVNISMLWTWEVMKKLYWIRKVEESVFLRLYIVT